LTPFDFIVDAHFRRIQDRHEAIRLFRRSVNMVEVEVFSYCNRRCWFCPNSLVDRQSKTEYMSEELYLRLLDDLAEADYRQMISYSRYNEPLADRIILRRIEQATQRLPKAILHTNTNGDYLTPGYLAELADAGLRSLNIQIYLGNDDRYDHERMRTKLLRTIEHLELNAPIARDDPGRWLEATTETSGIRMRIYARNFELNGCSRGDSVPRVSGCVRGERAMGRSESSLRARAEGGAGAHGLKMGDATESELIPCTLGELLGYFLRLGSFGFGGPIALVGYMQRDLVEERRWISAKDYGEGLALAQLAPGPLAAQLAIYLGWVRAGTFGATLVAVAFVAPSFVMVLALSALYLRYGGIPWMQGAFYGIGAAVIAIIARSAFKLARLTLGKDRLLAVIFVVSALVTAWTESEIIWVFLLSGVVALLRKTSPRWFPSSAAALASEAGSPVATRAGAGAAGAA
jgi:chromate transport protein ChrA